MSVRIKVDNLNKKMNTIQALQDVSIDFESGRLHGLIGPDGAGKTTLMRCLIGLLTAHSGTIQFEENNQNVTFQSIRSRMAYMPQQQSLYADLTVGEHLDFFRDLYVIPKDVYAKRRKDLLHMTRMDPFQDRPAGKLSGGMYKKLGLMCALLQSPEVVLLDEPTNGVDPISRREFWELLYKLLEQDILVIVSTAYMDEAERCSRVHVLDDSQLLASGEPRQVLEKECVPTFEALFVKREGGDVSMLQCTEKKEIQQRSKSKVVKKVTKKKTITKVIKKKIIKKAAKKKAIKKARIKKVTKKVIKKTSVKKAVNKATKKVMKKVSKKK